MVEAPARQVDGVGVTGLVPETRQRGMARTSRYVLLAVVLLLSLLLRLRFASVPLERDEGDYAYIAWLINDGGVPYRDAFDQKPPGVYFIYLGFMKLFGFTTEGLHFGLYGWTLGTILFVYLVASRVLSPVAGILAAAMFSVGSISPAFLGTAANTESLMVLPLAAAAFLASAVLAQRDAPLSRCLLCGLMVGAATTLKQVAVTDGAFFALVIVVATIQARRTPQALLARVAAVALGAAVAWIPLLAYFAAKGAVSNLLGDALLHNLRYSSIVPLSDYPENFFHTFRLSLIPYIWPYMAMALLGLVVMALRRGRGETEGFVWWFVPGWLLASFIGASVGGFFRQHYLLQTLAPLALLAGYFLDVATRRVPSALVRGALCAAAVVLPLVLNVRTFFVYSPDQLSNVIYPGNPFVESKRVADLVRRQTAPADKVLIVGSEPKILFYAQRHSASRYILTYPLMMDLEGAAERQVEMVAEAEAARPPLVVVVNVFASHLAGPSTSGYLFERVTALLEREYVRIYPIDDSGVEGGPPLQVFQRRVEGAGAS